jgi:hypothetical protein
MRYFPATTVLAVDHVLVIMSAPSFSFLVLQAFSFQPCRPDPCLIGDWLHLSGAIGFAAEMNLS